MGLISGDLLTSRGGFIGGAPTGGLRHVARRSADGGGAGRGVSATRRGRSRPSAARRVPTGAGGRIRPMIAEPTYEQVQALAIKLTQNLCKRVAAGRKAVERGPGGVSRDE